MQVTYDELSQDHLPPLATIRLLKRLYGRGSFEEVEQTDDFIKRHTPDAIDKRTKAGGPALELGDAEPHLKRIAGNFPRRAFGSLLGAFLLGGTAIYSLAQGCFDDQRAMELKHRERRLPAKAPGEKPRMAQMRMDLQQEREKAERSAHNGMYNGFAEAILAGTAFGNAVREAIKPPTYKLPSLDKVDLADESQNLRGFVEKLEPLLLQRVIEIRKKANIIR